MKQETLEELAEKLQEEIKYGASISDIIDTLTKWQQEHCYKELEEVKHLYLTALKQKERMYSEEEVDKILRNFRSVFLPFGQVSDLTLNNWFEQFKNK
jgi:phosphomevalonate kinase